MFNLTVIKTADLNNIKARLADLENDTDHALDNIKVLYSKHNTVNDAVQRHHNQTQKALATLEHAVLAKPKVCPLLTAKPKAEVDPVGAWESKQKVLERHLKDKSSELAYHKAVLATSRGVSHGIYLTIQNAVRISEQSVAQLHSDLDAHAKLKPAPAETAVLVTSKHYEDVVGLLKGRHITILKVSNHPKFTVGDTLLDVTPEQVYAHWDIQPHNQFTVELN